MCYLESSLKAISGVAVVIFVSLAISLAMPVGADDAGTPPENDASRAQPITKSEMAVEAIDGQVAADSYPNEWEYGTGAAVSIATSEDVYQTVPVDALKGQRVVNLQAKSVGTVDNVVQAQGENTAALVIKTGGFFGIGAKESVVPLQQFYFVGEQLVWETRLSKDNIKKSDRYEFDEDRFSSLLQD